MEKKRIIEKIKEKLWFFSSIYAVIWIIIFYVITPYAGMDFFTSFSIFLPVFFSSFFVVYSIIVMLESSECDRDDEDNVFNRIDKVNHFFRCGGQDFYYSSQIGIIDEIYDEHVPEKIIKKGEFIRLYKRRERLLNRKNKNDMIFSYGVPLFMSYIPLIFNDEKLFSEIGVLIIGLFLLYFFSIIAIIYKTRFKKGFSITILYDHEINKIDEILFNKNIRVQMQDGFKNGFRNNPFEKNRYICERLIYQYELSGRFSSKRKREKMRIDKIIGNSL